MRKKFQTTVRADGKTSVTQLGWVAEDRLEADMQQEKEHFGRLAMRDDLTEKIITTEECDDTLVVVHQSGKVIVLHWTRLVLDGSN